MTSITRNALAAATALSLALGAMAGHAAIVTVNFTGQLASADPIAGFTPPESITGQFVYDTDAAPISTDGEAALFPVQSFTVSDGFDWNLPDGTITIIDSPEADAIAVASTGDGLGDLQAGLTNVTGFWIDPTATALETTALPADPNFDAFTLNTFALDFGEEDEVTYDITATSAVRDGDDDDDDDDGDGNGRPTPVPEPWTITLLGAGLAGLLLRRRRP